MTIKTRKKLIEVALPLVAINDASAREKSIRHGHPSTLHLWWARRPLAAARAVIFAQMVDDPSSLPERFPTKEAQDKERQRLFDLIEELVKWENTFNEKVLEKARKEIWKSWRIACTDNKDHPQAKELFNPEKLPAFHDPFAGGGALPLEAQRLGLKAYASDLNPVAVLINKAMIEIPPKFANQPPINPEARNNPSFYGRTWKRAEGLAEDVRYYGKYMRDEAEKQIGHLYPKVQITSELVKQRPDLKSYLNQELTVIAWIWARTVKSPNPVYSHVNVPLAASFVLCSKKGKEAYIQPIIEESGYRFTVKKGRSKNWEETKTGTKIARGANFKCLMSGTPISANYIKSESRAGRLGERLMAIAVQGKHGRLYISPIAAHEHTAASATPKWKPEIRISGSTQYLGVKPYGIERFDQLFTNRQLVALTVFSDLVHDILERINQDMIKSGIIDDKTLTEGNESFSNEYAHAVCTYLAMSISKMSDAQSSLCRWKPSMNQSIATFGRQALPMVWDYSEANPFGQMAGDPFVSLKNMIRVLERLRAFPPGVVKQSDARSQKNERGLIVSTDPPYYDNVPYADLSDYFYIWLRRSLQKIDPTLFATITVPKGEELVAFAYRHENSKKGAETFFLEGMTQAMNQISDQAHPTYPLSIYYAFKQIENKDSQGISSTGWETFLDAVIRAGFTTTGTWPMRTELGNRLRSMDSNALASSIIITCRKRTQITHSVTRREFVSILKSELPSAISDLQASNIAPVDLAQSSIGPGMAIFTRFERILEADDSTMTVKTALQLINGVLDEYLSEQEGAYGPDTRFASTWFENYKFDEAAYGAAEVLATARAVSVKGIVEAGIIHAAAGKVRLLKREELPNDWDPAKDKRLTVWEATQHLIKRQTEHGESAAAELLARLGSTANQARDLAYRLYQICERKGWADEARYYNGLVIAWPELEKLANKPVRDDSSPQYNLEV